MTLAVERVDLIGFPVAGGWGVAAASRTGSQRDVNEDRWLVVPAAGTRPLLLAVADGVGGEAAGERASTAAVDSLRRAWESWQPTESPSDADLRRRLLDAARDADLAVRAAAAADPRFERAATTLTAAAVLDHAAIVVHAGDSRVYFVSSGIASGERPSGAGADPPDAPDGQPASTRARQLTADHTWVAEEIANRRLDPAEAERHPMRHVITRCLGIPGGCELDAFVATRHPGEWPLLCTDGVTNVVEDGELGGGPDAAEIVRRLMTLVTARNGSDDATLVVAVPSQRLADDPFKLRGALGTRSARRRGSLRAITRTALAAAGVAAVAGGSAWTVPRVARFLHAPFRPAPSPAAQEFLATWQAAQYEALYDQLSADAQRSIDRDAFVKRHQAIAAEMTLAKIALALAPEQSSVRLGEDEIAVPFESVYTTRRFGEIRRANTLPLRWEGGTWRVDWTPAVILPELTAGRLVRSFPDPGTRGAIVDTKGRLLALSPGPGADAKRGYPAGATAGPVLGYVGEVSAEELDRSPEQGFVPGDVVGRAGVEAAAEAALAGKRGGRLTVVAPSGEIATTLSSVPAGPGENVVLTLDMDLQAEAEAALGPRPGSVVVVDPRDGAIRALATFPRYDPGAFVTGNGAAAILNDPGLPLLDRPLQGQYPPGSIFKVITMAAAIERGGFQPDSEFTCTGRWTGLPGVAMDCWLKTGHGRLNLVSGLTQSCDTVFYELGKRLDEIDQELLPSFASRAGLGVLPRVLAGHEQAGIVPGPTWKQRVLNQPWTRGDAVNLAIGQGQLLVSPVQMAQLYAAIAAGGQGKPLKLLDRASLPGGNVERSLTTSAPLALPWSAAALDPIRAGLKGVVSAANGTAAFVFQGSPLHDVAAGKTGSAETVPGRNTHAWFTCFAPVDAPRAVVLAMVEYGGEGSSVAAPIARHVLEAALR